jgi:TolB-like protein
MGELYEELKRRNVVRVGIAYIVVAWIILQFTDLVLENMNAPEWVMQSIMLVLAIGLPVALVFAWAFELTPEGLKREKDVDRSQSVTHETGSRIQTVTIVLLVVALALSLGERFLVSGEPEQPAVSEVVGQSPRSIAVLPFVDMSADKSYGYFSDGLSEELLNLLAKNPDLRVAARTSSFAFKGQNQDITDIARTLNVDTILEGSVRHDGNMIRVTTQLINAADGYHLWSETYDRELTSIFALQDEIARQITVALNVTLGTDNTMSRGRPTDNMQAYALYLRAMERMRLGGVGFEDATRMAEDAIRLDPNFAEAYEIAAVAAWSNAGIGWSSEFGLAEARRYAEAALALKPDLLWAATILVGSNPPTYDRFEEMEAQKRLIAAQPSNSKAKAGLIYNLLFLGYLDEAQELAEALTELDPLYPSGHGYLGSAYFAKGDLDAGRREWQIAKDLGFETFSYYLSYFYFKAGDVDEAVRHIVEDLRFRGQPTEDITRIIETIIQDRPSGADLRAMLIKDNDWREGANHWMLFSLFGYTDELFETLVDVGAHGKAQNEAEALLSDLTVFRPSGYMSDPRYVEIAEAYGMADAWRKRGAPDHCQPDGNSWVCK